MMDKLFLFRTLIITLLLCLLVWDGLLLISGNAQRLPHRDFLLTGTLLWFVTLFFNRNSDDDWAGQF